MTAPSAEREFMERMIARLAQKSAHRIPLHVRLINTVQGVFYPRLVETRLVKLSPLFDEIYYLQTNPDVAALGIDPAFHYVHFGEMEGRAPNPVFGHEDMRLKIPPQHNVKNTLLAFQAWLVSGLSTGAPVAGDAGALSDDDRAAIARHIDSLMLHPKIAVVMPVYNPDLDYLAQAIASVQAQRYDNWELCIADDASRDPRVRQVLRDCAARDSRIKITFRKENGHIARATNSALALVSASHAALMDQDDLLHETALYEVAHAISKNPKARLIYSDEDRIDGRNAHHFPYHKPDFNIELLLGQNFVNHLAVYETTLLRELGGLRTGFDGSQDYDLALRAVNRLRDEEIVHIPAVLYHWRMAGRTASFSERHADTCAAAARAAIQDFLDKQGEGARVVPLAHKSLKNYSRVIRKPPQPLPKVSIIVPTRNRADLLATCIDGLLNKTSYGNFELIIVDNKSDEPAALALLDRYGRDPRVKVLQHKGPFNYSAINNRAARMASGAYLALLNNDIEILHPDWLDEMVAEACRADVGAVGAKLYYPNGQIQHAGVVVGMGGLAGHVLARAKGDATGYFCSAALTRAFSAVTAACMVVNKKKFLAVGGFDEKNLPVAFNDVDLCLRLMEAGYRNVWTPFARLVHHESASRGAEDTTHKQIRSRLETRYLRQRWKHVIADDKYYNPNLALGGPEYAVVPSRRAKPWAAFL